ncbi:phage baseplate assembly protein [Burkholderia pseudomallei]|uniref:phage baseplate assembly protein n=1 Tax=Burkholderia pseudomallei TaxID=28450 RepID=UPI000975C32F|nr:Mu P family protein [Burkholderia pseudomallei]OMQ57070.1 Mu P family protein [Burkholderia pseudomallei]OMQ65136.1 Mu P family protein [Burkholderia pseudomallei]OMQ72867.1 Mu P family protein [Burkholderia pseudomallei]CAJ2713839.1 Mu P family protein [Burkholderia pseudomallei]CAJ4672084.1 Mu P family protein [Burkholderia pseudomallei]
MVDDGILLSVGNYMLAGWTYLRCTRGIERFPSDFEIGMTELFPGQANDVVVQPGDPCVLTLGVAPVVTGYVDRVVPSINAAMHEIRVTGRGRCQDLLDCAAQWPSGQISNCTAADIATKLAVPYNITVNCDATGLPIIPQQNIMLGETAYEIIERSSRFSALLVYEDSDGTLKMTRAGTEAMSSGIQEGINMESCAVERSMDQRYSEIIAVMIGTNNLLDLNAVNAPVFTATDPNVTRHRRRIIIAEAGELGWDIGKQRALWEVARRRGRSEVVHVTVDNWYDVDGNLWEPNKLIDVLIPSMKVSGDQAGTVPVRYLIAEVTYHLGLDGTHAELTLMAPEAFTPQPVLLLPQYGDVIGTVPQQ